MSVKIMSVKTGFRFCIVCTGVNIALAVVHLQRGNMVMVAVSVVGATAVALLGSFWWGRLGAVR